MGGVHGCEVHGCVGGRTGGWSFKTSGGASGWIPLVRSCSVGWLHFSVFIAEEFICIETVCKPFLFPLLKRVQWKKRSYLLIWTDFLGFVFSFSVSKWLQVDARVVSCLLLMSWFMVYLWAYWWRGEFSFYRLLSTFLLKWFIHDLSIAFTQRVTLWSSWIYVWLLSVYYQSNSLNLTETIGS